MKPKKSSAVWNRPNTVQKQSHIFVSSLSSDSIVLMDISIGYTQVNNAQTILYPCMIIPSTISAPESPSKTIPGGTPY